MRRDIYGMPGGLPVSPALLTCGACLAVVIVFAHRSNIAKLIQGQEAAFGDRRRKR